MNLRQFARGALLASVLLGAGGAPAAPILVTGSWSFTVDGDGFANETFTGSASFTFDDAFVTGSGIESLGNIPLLSFIQDPAAIGATTFDTSNVSGFVGYIDGVIQLMGVGGNISGETAISAGNDDFSVYESGLGPDGAAIAKATSTSIARNVFDITVDFTPTRITEVPEPSSFALFGLAVAAAAGAGRRRAARV